MAVVEGFTFVPWYKDGNTDAFLDGYSEAHKAMRDSGLTHVAIESAMQDLRLNAPMGSDEEMDKVKGAYLAYKGALLEGIRL